MLSSTNSNSFGGQPYGFTGLEHDESGLVYARNRYYSPSLGRFISEDPIGFGGGANFYAYCGNDPINFTDPLGLYGISDFMGDVGGTLGQLSNGGVWRDGLGTSGVALADAGVDMATGMLALDPFGIVNPLGDALNDGYKNLTSPYFGSYRCSPGYGFSKGAWTVAAMAAGGAAGLAEAEAAGLAGAKGGCFVAGTPVTLGSGERAAIEMVKQGDTLQARDADTGKVEARVVKRTSKVTSYELVTIEIADVASGKVVDTITGTPNHPFYVSGKGWVPLGQLGIGTSLVTRAGPNNSNGVGLVVKSVRRESHPEGVLVYNFVVEGFHTYFVGTANGGVWVHNGLPCFEPNMELTGNLRPTHPISRNRPFKRLVKDIEEHGIKEPLKYVEDGGKKYVVDGNHRLGAAKELGIRKVPAEKVELPYAGYITPDDLIYGY